MAERIDETFNNLIQLILAEEFEEYMYIRQIW